MGRLWHSAFGTFYFFNGFRPDDVAADSECAVTKRNGLACGGGQDLLIVQTRAIIRG